MAKQAKQWLDDNPGSTITLQEISRTAVIGILKEALDLHFISANEDARKLFLDCGWLETGPDAPTPTMVKIALEMVGEAEV